MTDKELFENIDGNYLRDVLSSIGDTMDFEQSAVGTVALLFMEMHNKEEESGEPYSDKHKKAAEFIRAFESYPNEGADLALWYIDMINAVTDSADVDDETKDEHKLILDDSERDQFRVEFQEMIDEILGE